MCFGSVTRTPTFDREISTLLEVLDDSKNYAAVIVRVPEPYDVEGLDNLVGRTVFGSQILSQRVGGVETGELAVYFPAESALSQEYASANNLFRKSELNADKAENGYLEENGRVKAIRLRKVPSNALLMPLSSLAYLGDVEFREGDTFNAVNGHVVCKKYKIIHPPQSATDKKVAKAFKRVSTKVFPEHLDSENFWRNVGRLDPLREVIVTQKLHGTSGRWGRVPVLRVKGRVERFINWLGFDTPTHQHEFVSGSRKVIKDPKNAGQNHFYKYDLWTEFGETIAHLIPDGFIVYGELIGWTADGAPIQKGYTYDVPKGEQHLHVYRVARVDVDGVLTDLSWDGVKVFCRERGLRWVPEICRVLLHRDDLVDVIDDLMNLRYSEMDLSKTDRVVPLSDPKTVDEGVCVRQDAIVPTILKAKASSFLEHETKLLDKGEADLESVS